MDPVPPEGLLSPNSPLSFTLVTGLSRLRGAPTRPQHDAGVFLFCRADNRHPRGRRMSGNTVMPVDFCLGDIPNRWLGSFFYLTRPWGRR